MKIFLSHTHADKPVVEPIALRLREIFGQENVFYDSWSIQPGDGILKKMNEGLSAPDYVFFFVSEESLKSKMVEMEWQNALYASTKGRVRIIPIRVDGSSMPPLLLQNLWIDLYSQGVEATLHQIVNVAQGQNTFVPQHQQFSNLTYSLTQQGSVATVTIVASHLMEPKASFAIGTRHNERELECKLVGNVPFIAGYVPSVGKTEDGVPFNVFTISRLGDPVTPKNPLRIELRNREPSKQVVIVNVLHNVGEDMWQPVPFKAPAKTPA